MNQNLNSFLIKRFPSFFNNPKISFNFRGFECNDGWFQIIYNSCITIENHINSLKNHNEHRALMKKNHDEGKPLSEHFQEEYDLNQLAPYHVPDFFATQVKEKFGSLRFYHQGSDEYIKGVIASLSNHSSSICEVCGNKGKLQNSGYMQTLCPKHASSPNESKPLQKDSDITALLGSEFKSFKIVKIDNDSFICILKEDINSLKNNTQYVIKERKSEMFSFFEVIE